MIKRFDTYIKEDLSFEKIESEEAIFDLNDYIEEYENIFKDNYRCVKSSFKTYVIQKRPGHIAVDYLGNILKPGKKVGHDVGDVINIKNLFNGQFGILTTKKARFEGDKEAGEHFTIVDAWDCEFEKIKNKKGSSIVIWPGHKERLLYIDRLNRLKDKNREKDKILKRYALHYNGRKKFTIPANRIIIYNINQFIRDIRNKLAESENNVMTGTAFNGEPMIVKRAWSFEVDSPKYLRVTTLNDRFRSFTFDITKPLSIKSAYWIDPVFDPYGEEDWDD